MAELLGLILSAMLAYFLVRLDSIEKRIDKLSENLSRLPRRSSDSDR